MNYEIAMKWCEALKSGKYKQGNFVLRNCNDEYCCLGVLCDISNLGEWGKGVNIYWYTGSFSVLPFGVMTWAEMKTSRGRSKLTSSHSLVALNDEFGYSFEQIADYIEENWEEL